LPEAYCGKQNIENMALALLTLSAVLCLVSSDVIKIKVGEEYDTVCDHTKDKNAR
jgi:hypothetical protein